VRGPLPNLTSLMLRYPQPRAMGETSSEAGGNIPSEVY